MLGAKFEPVSFLEWEGCWNPLWVRGVYRLDEVGAEVGMKACLLAVLSLVSVVSAWAQGPYTDEQVIAYAKAIDVKTLDASLPSQRLEDWLQGGAVHGHVYYGRVAASCDLAGDSSWKDYPLCVKIAVGRNGEVGYFLVQVGTWHKLLRGRGMLGARRVYASHGCHFELELESGAGACDGSSSIFACSAYQDATEFVRQRLVRCSLRLRISFKSQDPTSLRG